MNSNFDTCPALSLEVETVKVFGSKLTRNCFFFKLKVLLSKKMLSLFLLRVDESSSESYIDRKFFFVFRKNFDVFYKAQFFCGLTFDFFFKFISFPLPKGRQTPLSNSESVKFTKNVIDLLFGKWNLTFRFPSEI